MFRVESPRTSDQEPNFNQNLKTRDHNTRHWHGVNRPAEDILVLCVSEFPADWDPFQVGVLAQVSQIGKLGL